MEGKSLGKILTASVLGLGLLFTPVKKSDAGEFYFYGTLLYGPKTADASRATQIDSVPNYIRDVPAHPDDLWKVNPEDVAPISDAGLMFSTISSSSLVSINLNVGVGYRDDIFDFTLGPKLSFSSLDRYGSLSIKERNYTNHPGTEDRSVGAALTYYGFDFESLPLSLGALARASLAFDISEGNKVLFFKPFIGYSATYSPSHFFVENGWDRYGHLEQKEKYKLTDGFINHSIEGGISFSLPGFSLELFSGIDIPQTLNTTLGNETGFRYDSTPNFFAGVRSGFSIDSFVFQ
jgi:hypothetical protein